MKDKELPLNLIHGALTAAIAEKDKELFKAMENQIQTAIELRDRATQIALNFAGQRISSLDGSYELLIELIHAELMAADEKARAEQAPITAMAERAERVEPFMAPSESEPNRDIRDVDDYDYAADDMNFDAARERRFKNK